MMVERSFGMKKKKKRGRTGPARVFECRLDWLHFIHRCCDADRVFFPCWRKAFWNFSWLELALSPTCTQIVAFVAGDDFLARTLAVLPLSFYLCLSLSLSLSLSTFISHRCNFLFIMYSPVFQASERATSIRVPSRINSFCRAVGLSSFILPPRYLALIVSRSSATFYVGFDHPCGEVTRRSGCTFLSHANLIAFLHPSRTRSPFP